MSTQAEVLATHTPALFAAAVERAVALLRAGEVVALPTETVYGLAANAYDERAVRRLFRVKGRPSNNPIIVHVADVPMARGCVAAWSPAAERLANAFWPGPLTLVMPKADVIPPIVSAGGPTVGVRWPQHPFIQAVIRQGGFPLAAPSANRSAELSPTNAEHVRQSLGDRIPLIVDGGQAQVGIESTVLDVTAIPARILRPGVVHEATLRAVLGEAAVARHEPGVRTADGPERSPGLRHRHYAPKARLLVLNWRDEVDLRAQLARLERSAEHCCIVAHSHVPGPAGFAEVSVIPHDPEAFARALYAELHRCDAIAGVAAIVVEAVPDEPAWRGVADRLRRGAATEP